MRSRTDTTTHKLRGGYYTPPDLAGFISRWVSGSDPASILEPSCGDGAFFPSLAACAGSRNAQLTACEIEPGEASKAMARARSVQLPARVLTTDFLEWALPRLQRGLTPYDAVVGNPPFIRYQYLPCTFQAFAAEISQTLGCRFTRHTNAWVPFLLASVALLRPGGRLGMILPAELIHVNYARAVRRFLSSHCAKIVIIDPIRLWFPETLQGALLVLLEKANNADHSRHRLGIVSVQDREFLTSDPEDLFRKTRTIRMTTLTGKWTPALVGPAINHTLHSVDRLPAVHRFGRVATAHVGIVTGANAFFCVNDATVNEYQLGRFAHPMFGRSAHAPGVIYDHHQHQTNVTLGRPTNFLWFRGTSVLAHRGSRNYIAGGERQGLHTRFKCRIRSPWYEVPSVYATHLSMLKRAHDAPRLVVNRVKAFTTDTAYRVRTWPVAPEHLASCFLNPLTALSAELEGRHYGGGVLELVPSEIQRLLVPLPAEVPGSIDAVDQLLRARTMQEVMSEHGIAVLSRAGVSSSDSYAIMEAWAALRGRRQRKPLDAAQRVENGL